MVRNTWMLIGCSLAVFGCVADEEDYGTARLGLVGYDEQGTAYALRDATFDVQGPVSTALGTADSPDNVETLTVSVPPGTYEVRLLEGWTLVQGAPNDDVALIVPASLVSANPAVVEVFPNTTSAVVFSFLTDDGVIETDAGTLDIDIDVDRPDPEPQPGACDPLAQDCAAPQACTLPFSEEEFACVTPSPSAGGQFGHCATVQMCREGFACIGEQAWQQCASEFGCCQAFCSTNADCSSYGSNLQCRPLNVPGYPNVGTCAR